MKARNLIIGLVATGTAAAGGFALPTVASAHTNVPFVSQVDIKLVSPSTITSTGAYKREVLARSHSNLCSFYLYRYTDYYGYWQGLGHYSGTSTIDLIQQYFGYTEYEMIPYDCYGNSGSGNYSDNFNPNAWDNPFYVTAGSATTAYSTKYFGGSALQTTTGLGTQVEWNTDYSYNDGVVIGTGPKGGIGTVYVNGVKKGTINFYSLKVHGMKLAFKFGTYNPEYNSIVIRMTGSSHGGHTMYLDAGIENDI
jgi:hypothetical protein